MCVGFLRSHSTFSAAVGAAGAVDEAVVLPGNEKANGDGGGGKGKFAGCACICACIWCTAHS
jgi:hypothetical protein